MSLVCAQCSRVNPAEASYCYFDGAALAGRQGGPVNAGSAPFPNQFVFPSGQSCRNFDQLALACQQNWSSAVDLLKKGFLASFFGNLGRVDLAMAAQELANFPDQDRGLDQLLAKLPTQALQPPKLKAEPSDISLGVLKVGTDRATELHLSNLGMRLLYGSVASDCKWLTLGEAPGVSQKLFQFGADSIIPVQVHGKHLRAGTKPLEGRLLVESNGGQATVTVRAEVPITAYKDGLFAGAITPRQVAEKAKANPKDAAPYFEDGLVAAWYASNGWKYPVEGPTMSGMGAIQQFFEALGVAKPPKLEIATQALELAAEAGQTLETQIEVSTSERKPAYAWAQSDQPWLEVGKTKLNGRSATVPLTLRIPASSGPLLETKLRVVGNGNQKFTVPLRVKVSGGVPMMEIPLKELAPLEPALAGVGGANPFATLDAPTDGVQPPPAPPLKSDDGQGAPFRLDPVEETAVTSVRSERRSGGRRGQSAGDKLSILQLVPMGVLFLVLGIVLVHDFFSPRSQNAVGADAGDVDARPRIGIQFDYQFGAAKDSDVVHNNMGFGIVKLDPDLGNVASPPRLTFGPRGHTNSSLVEIDGKDYLFGDQKIGGMFLGKPQDVRGYGGKSVAYKFGTTDVVVTQDVRLVPSEPVKFPTGEYKRVLDTCLVKYKLENRDKRPHRVGLRFELDTYIADNDGVPFTLPGEKELVSTQKDFKTPAEVPDFIQVLQRSNLKDPGLIMQLGLRVSKNIETPERVSLTRYEENARKKWDYPMDLIKKSAEDAGDSAVVMYWQPEELQPGKHREIGFTYGLGTVEIGPEASIGLSVGGSFYVGGDLSVVALVAEPTVKTVRIELPPGLTLLTPPDARPVPPLEKAGTNKDGKDSYRPNPLTWRVRATQAGDYNISAISDTGITQTRRVRIETKSLF